MSSPDNTPPANSGEGVSPVDLDYELIRLIGRGAYGEVWLVRDKDGAYRACKVVYRASFHHDRPYEREYERIGKFEPVSRASPSQVKILHVGRRDAAGCFYYIMELADDAHENPVLDPKSFEPKTLRGELHRRRRIPAKECIEIGLSLSAALENLHQHGLIHRDIKPANIIFVHNIPKLADIGLVTDADVTVSYVGTGGFIPPEGPGSPQADVYGLGKVLYEISTGKDRLEYPELPVDFGELPDRELLLELNSVVSHACEADIKKRYPSASALHADLRLLKRGKSVRQARTSIRKKTMAVRWAHLDTVLGLGEREKRRRAAALHNAGACSGCFRMARSVLDCGSPLPLSPRSARLPSRQGFARTVMRCAPVRWAAALGLALLCGAAILHFAEKPNPSRPSTPALALPDAAQVAQNEAKFREAYQTQLDRGPAAARQLAAAELVKQSDVMTDPAMQLAALRVAAQLAVEAEDFSQATQICETMAGRFPIETLAVETELFSRAGGYVRTAGKYADLAGYCLAAGFKAIAVDDYVSGRKLADLSRTCAQQARDARRVKEAGFLDTEIQRCGAEFALVKPWEDTLHAKPDDPEANTAVGKFLCLVKNDWEAGLPMLAHSTNGALRSVAATEINHTPTTSDAQIALGNSWRDFATGTTGDDGYWQRARYWYLKGLASVAPAERSRLQDEQKESINGLPAEPGEMHIFSRFVGAQTIDIYSDELRWRSGHSAVNTRINQVNLGDLKRGDLTVIKNNGTTWLLPASVDFSTARLIVNHKPKGKARTILDIAPDHVRVTLAHSGNGFAEFEVTVTFGKAP